MSAFLSVMQERTSKMAIATKKFSPTFRVLSDPNTITLKFYKDKSCEPVLVVEVDEFNGLKSSIIGIHRNGNIVGSLYISPQYEMTPFLTDYLKKLRDALERA